MHSIEIALVALALSIDAFAVSLGMAAAGRINGSRPAFRVAFHFGFFQFLMPVLGWAAGATLEPVIKSFDHWVAFVLLVGVGARMLRASGTPDKLSAKGDPSRGLTLLVLSTAVSIDALAVGLSLAMLNVAIWSASVLIGLVTATMSMIGILIGGRLHSRLGRFAEIVGGVVLILIAVRIVVSHLTAS